MNFFPSSSWAAAHPARAPQGRLRTTPKKDIMIRSVSISMALLLGALALHAQTSATLNIEVNQTKSAVSPTLYGLMTEEINYSYDGGLYAELIRNRTFRSDWTGVLNWFLVEKGSAAAKIGVDPKEGPSSALTGSAKREVTKADANSSAGILNEGYWGIAVRPNTRYTGSFFAKTTSDVALPVTIALVADHWGQVLAKTSVPVGGTAWKQYTFEMQSGNAAASSENHFEMTLDRPATLWLQLVSLFPPTYHSRTNGNRIDIMEKLAAMKPALFVNVNPGGMQWTSDLIGYNALNSYGSPSYYAQVMFSSCLGDRTANSSVSGASDKFFYSVTASPGKLCLKLVNASSAPQPVNIAFNGTGAGTHAATFKP